MDMDFDLCILGGGPGGFAAAMRAVDAGKRVCLIEGGQIGGAGVMWGALASKTMWELAKDYHVAAKVDRGYRAAGLRVDCDLVQDTVMRAVKEKQYQMLSQLQTFSPRRCQGPGCITLERGWGRFVGPHQVAITGSDGAEKRVSARYFLIATGSRPRQFPGITVDQKRIFDSDGIVSMTQFPKRLMIVGAGIIGCEYATIFSNFGQTQVYLVDHQDRVIPYEDADVSEFVSHSLAESGVNILHSASLKEVLAHPDYLEVVLDFGDGHSEVIEVDAMLISIGRKPNINRIGLEKLGITPNERGFLPVDQDCRVRDHIYAAGDVTPHPALVNMAEMEGRYAVKHMFDFVRWPLNYTNMSTIMFFMPSVAAIGLSEKTCRQRNIAYRVAWCSHALLNRAIAMRAARGFVKIIVSDDDEQKILGMRAAGPQSSSTIMSIAFFMDQGKGIDEILKSVYPHPTISESIQECVRLLLGKSIYKPRAFPEHLKTWSWGFGQK